jgi:hypothetical protein
MFSANVEEKHIKQTSIYDNKKKKEEDGGAFIHMNSGYYSIFFFYSNFKLNLIYLYLKEFNLKREKKEDKKEKIYGKK